MIDKLFERYRVAPLWWKSICAISLCACGVWPLVWFGSIFVFDHPSDSEYYLLRYIVGIIDSYPLWILPLNGLALWIYHKTNSTIIGLSIYLLPVLLIWGGKTYFYHGQLPTYMYERNDVRLFDQTPAATLAKAIIHEDTLAIDSILTQSPELIDYVEEYHQESMLFYAYDRGAFAAVRHLIQNGADVNEYNANGQTLLHRLCDGEMIEEEIERNFLGMRSYALLKVMPSQDAELIQFLLEHGANPNLLTIERGRWSIPGYTAVQILCFFGPDSPEILTMLIEYGADLAVQRIGYEGQTFGLLYDACCRNENYQVTFALLEAGVEPDSLTIRYLTNYKDKNESLQKIWHVCQEMNMKNN